MGPTWVLSAADGPHVGPRNFAIRIYWWQLKIWPSLHCPPLKWSMQEPSLRHGWFQLRISLAPAYRIQGSPQNNRWAIAGRNENTTNNTGVRLTPLGTYSMPSLVATRRHWKYPLPTAEFAPFTLPNRVKARSSFCLPTPQAKVKVMGFHNHPFHFSQVSFIWFLPRFEWGMGIFIGSWGEIWQRWLISKMIYDYKLSSHLFLIFLKPLPTTSLVSHTERTSGGNCSNLDPVSFVWCIVGFVRSILQIPQWIIQISHNALFCNKCAHFWYKMVHCGIWDWCILGFVRLVCIKTVFQVHVHIFPL